VPVVKKIMAAADSTPILRERVSLLNQDVSLLGQINVNLRIKDSLNVEIIKAEREKSVIMQEQRGLYDAELSNMRNLYKKERRKRIWTQVFGIVGISGALYLGLQL
jgi:hypothetical protein